MCILFESYLWASMLLLFWVFFYYKSFLTFCLFIFAEIKCVSIVLWIISLYVTFVQCCAMAHCTLLIKRPSRQLRSHTSVHEMKVLYSHWIICVILLISNPWFITNVTCSDQHGGVMPSDAHCTCGARIVHRCSSDKLQPKRMLSFCFSDTYF